MENGVSKVEEVKPKVEEFDNDVLGDGMKGIETDDVESVSATIEVEETPIKEANGDVESVSTTIEAEETPRKDGSDVNGVNPSVSLELDGSVDAGQSVVEKFEDAIETPYETQTAMENTHVDPVEEAISPKVIDEDTINDQPIVIENDKLVDSDEHEAKKLNLADVTEDKSATVNTLSDIPSNLEANEAVNDDNIEAKVGESTSDNATKLVSVTDEQNTYTDVIKDDQNVLENNGVVDNGVNEVTNVSEPKIEDQMTILEDIHHKKPVDVILPKSENGVSDDIHLEENVIHEDHVIGDSVSHKTQPDGELGVEVNGDVPSQLHEKEMLVTEGKDDDTKNVEIPTDISHNIQNEPKVEESQVVEQKTSAPSSEQVSTSAINEPNSKPEIPKVETLPSEKTEPKDHEVKLDNITVKKEPVIGVSLPTEKPATSTPIPNPKPTQPSIPNSKPTTATPPPAQTRPAGLGNAAPLLEPAHRVVPSQPNGNVPPQNQVIDEPTNEPEENDDTREKLQMIRVKFLRLARRLGQTPHNVVVAQVLYRLGLAEQLRGRNGGRVAAFSFERASAMAEQLESTGQEPLEFSCTIMVLGKTGVGKSATINSIFDENKFNTDAFQLGTKKVQDVVGTVQGIKVRVIDTPGLLSSWNDQRKNEKILHSVKKFIQKSPPDIVLYLDRLDMQSRDFGDMPLLRTITDIFGQSIWFNAIVVLTHAASAPPEGPNGTTTSYDMFVTQRSHVVQQAIRQAAGDMRLMNPVSLVENHSACRTNRAGQRVLPNGQVWKPHLLLLSFASKILVEANMLLKLQDSPPGKPFGGQRTRAPPLPFILSNLLQSRPQLNLPNEQFGDDDDVDDDDDVASDDEVSEYDELPPFKRLTSVQLAKLSKQQKKAYIDELEYREKLFMKKQLKEEKKRRKLMKKMAEEAKNFPEEIGENLEEDGNAAATVPVAVQDMNLPVSFDADNPTHRYRALDSANQWLIRPVLDPHGWDHDVGYEGINIEHLLALKEKIPVSFSGQVTKDKKDANLQMEVSTGVKHGKSKSKSTTVAFDMQTVGKDISYTLRSETRFLNYKKNKASVGFSVTHFGDSVTGGVKFEDKLVINRRGQVVVAGGAVMGRGDVAYGGSLEATLRDKDYPLGRFLSTVGLSVMDWHGDLAIGWNAQSQIPIGRFTNLIGRVNLNNKGSGQVSVRLNSSEQLQIALVAFVPVVCKLIGYYQPRDTSY